MQPGKSAAYKPIPVLYEDEYYVAFDKPPGLVVIPTPDKHEKTMLDIVNAQFSHAENSGRLHPCHRLDRDTSGVILFAKGKKNQQRMMDVFQRRAITKQYIAFVHGKIKNPYGEIKGLISGFDKKKFTPHAAPKLAVTQYKLLENKREFSILEVYPFTGRTNQIRIQFSEIGHPLVGEQKYAFRKDFPLRFKRTALHASELVFAHPVLKKKIKIKSELPKDMEVFIAKNG